MEKINNSFYFSVISTNPDVLLELGKEEVSLIKFFGEKNHYMQMLHFPMTVPRVDC